MKNLLIIITLLLCVFANAQTLIRKPELILQIKAGVELVKGYVPQVGEVYTIYFRNENNPKIRDIQFIGILKENVPAFINSLKTIASADDGDIVKDDNGGYWMSKKKDNYIIFNKDNAYFSINRKKLIDIIVALD